MKIKIRFTKDDISVFFLALLCVCLLSPSVAKTVGGVVILLIAAICLLTEINYYNSCSGFEKNTLLLVVLYLLMILAYRFIGISTASLSHHMITIRFFLPFICMLPLYRRLTKRQCCFLLWVVLLTMAATIAWNFHLKNIWGYRYTYQLSSRAGVRGVINTQYTTAIMLASGALFSVFLRPGRRTVRYASLFGVILCMYFNIVVTQRAITFLLSIIMFVLLYLVNNKNNSTRRVIGGVCVILLSILFILEYDTILTWVANFVSSTRLRSRILSIIRLLQAENLEAAGGSSLTARLRLMSVSLRTFLGSFSHFFIGAGHRIDTNSVIGNHSQLIDEFARYGFFGGLLSSVMCFRLLREIKIMSGVYPSALLWRHLNVIVVIAVLRTLVGTIFDAAIGVVIFVMIPLQYRLLQSKEADI